MRRISVRRRAALAAGALCLGLGALGPAAQAAHHGRRAASVGTRHRLTPPDSYLQYKVYSVDQLIEQVSGNPQVRARFARHFQIPEDRVVSYMRANLVESYIPKTGHYTVYCVHHSGKFYPVSQTFRRGTKVFALRNGEPVMKWVCGNPLSHFLPSVQVRTIASRPPVVTKVSPYRDTLPAETQDILIPAEVNAPVYQPLVPVPVAAISSAAAASGAGKALYLLPAFGLLGLHTGHHNNVILPAVPEADTAAYLFAGLPIIFLAVRRRRDSVKV